MDSKSTESHIPEIPVEDDILLHGDQSSEYSDIQRDDNVNPSTRVDFGSIPSM